MFVVCLDLEGVLVPEIWINVAEKTGIEKLRLTTRDIPDYDVLMKGRIEILKEHGLTLKDIQDVIATIKPLDGAYEFFEKVRSLTQVVILSDTFSEFAKPLMKQLGMPTIFCNTLLTSPDGMITGFSMRCSQTKLTTVRALQTAGCETIATGDSYNDLDMIRASKAGFLFRSTEKIRQENPDIPAYETYEELLQAFRSAL